MEQKTLYCELPTTEQVAEFETLMTDMGHKMIDRPAKWAERPPYWFKVKIPRGENDDPLAAIILTIYPSIRMFNLYSGYRCVKGTKIEPEIMKCIITCLGYKKM